jgi:hypothetical protein
MSGAMRRPPPGGAHLPAVGAGDGPADPCKPQRGFEQRRPLALACGEPRHAGRKAHGPEVESAAAERTGGGSHRCRGMEGPGLWHARVACHADRSAARGAVRVALGLRRLHDRCTPDPHEHRPAGRHNLGEGHQDSPVAADHTRSADAGLAEDLPCSARGTGRCSRRRASIGCSNLLARSGRKRVGQPDTVGLRYTRTCARLGWDMHLHQLRHYSATELIAAGVDVRTVAGRLGHSGGGTTTLKVYSAWRSEADQRAASSHGMRMPALPIGVDPAAPLAGPSLTDGLVEAHPLGRSRRLELGSRLARAAGGRDAEAVCAATWTFPPGDGVRSARPRGRPRCRCLSASRAGVAVAASRAAMSRLGW